MILSSSNYLNMYMCVLKEKSLTGSFIKWPLLILWGKSGSSFAPRCSVIFLHLNFGWFQISFSSEIQSLMRVQIQYSLNLKKWNEKVNKCQWTKRLPSAWPRRIYISSQFRVYFSKSHSLLLEVKSSFNLSTKLCYLKTGQKCKQNLIRGQRAL